MCRGRGGFVPFAHHDEAYKHLGVMLRADGASSEVWADGKHGLRGKCLRAIGLLGRMRRVTAREYCKVADVLLRGLVCFYGQQIYVSFEQAEVIEREVAVSIFYGSFQHGHQARDKGGELCTKLFSLALDPRTWDLPWAALAALSQ